MANTMPRSMRIDEGVWQRASARAKRDGVTITDLVERLLAEYGGPDVGETSVCNACGWEGAGDHTSKPCPRCRQDQVNCFLAPPVTPQPQRM